MLDVIVIYCILLRAPACERGAEIAIDFRGWKKVAVSMLRAYRTANTFYAVALQGLVAPRVEFKLVTPNHE